MEKTQRSAVHFAAGAHPKRAQPSRVLSLLAVAVVPSLLAAWACTGLPPGDRLPDAGAADAGGVPSDNTRCESAQPPARPNAADANSVPELVFASSQVSSGAELGPDGAPLFRQLGYDLDGACTDEDGEDSCQPPSWAMRVSDTRAGRDVNLNELFFETEALLPGAATSYFTDAQGNAAGESGILIRLRDYNGKRDDPQVALVVYGATLWVNGARPAPRWDGQDVWHPTPPWLRDSAADALDADRPRFTDNAAYVNEGRLVSRFETIYFGSAWAPAGTLHQALITADLVKTDDGFALRNGVITGRWRVDSFLYFLALEIDPPDGGIKCRGMGLAELAQEVFCPLPDISATDDSGAGTCDAFSLMFGFEGDPARVGEPLPLSALGETDCNALGCDGKPLRRPADWPEF